MLERLHWRWFRIGYLSALSDTDADMPWGEREQRARESWLELTNGIKQWP